MFDTCNHRAFPPNETSRNPGAVPSSIGSMSNATVSRKSGNTPPGPVHRFHRRYRRATRYRQRPFGGIRGQPDGLPSARIVEVSHDQDPAVLWELRLEDEDSDGPAMTYVHRAERIASLTP